MFNSLTGIITGKFPKQLFLDTNGVEWDLCVPDSNLDMFGVVGSEARVYTWLQHTDQDFMNLNLQSLRALVPMHRLQDSSTYHMMTRSVRV